jgi:hypothetical protein
MSGLQPRGARPPAGACGYVAIELALSIGLLVLPLTGLVVTFPTWAERQSVARVVAREVARSVALDGVCDPAGAVALAATVTDGLGIPAGDVTVSLDCVPGQQLARGGAVTASATVVMPALAIPGIGAVDLWRWTAANRQPVDPFRSLR